MELPKQFDNINQHVIDDLRVTLKRQELAGLKQKMEELSV
jgi:hypothetical protein